MSRNYVITGRSGRAATVGFGLTIDVSELRALAADLDTGATRLGARTSAVFRAGALRMQAAAQSNAAVDTGTMKASISTDFIGDGRSGAMACEIGPTVDYGEYVESGTSKMAPQPYLGPAYDANIGPLSDALGKLAEELL